MRRPLIAAFVLVPSAVFALSHAELMPSLHSPTAQAAAPTAKARACDEHCSPAWMDANLRLDQIQQVGTAESYKQRPDGALLGLIRLGGKKDEQALDYGLPTLQAQLDSDVRALSFDVAYDPSGGTYKNPAGAGMAMDLLPDDYAEGDGQARLQGDPCAGHRLPLVLRGADGLSAPGISLVEGPSPPSADRDLAAHQ